MTFTAAVQDEMLDELGHVNNSEYFRWVELAARRHADSVGVTFEAMGRLGGAFVVRSHAATYFGECTRGDLLEIVTFVHSFKGARCTRDVTISRVGSALFQCRTEWVWIDRITRKPRRIPESVERLFFSDPSPADGLQIET